MHITCITNELVDRAHRQGSCNCRSTHAVELFTGVFKNLYTCLDIRFSTTVKYVYYKNTGQSQQLQEYRSVSAITGIQVSLSNYRNTGQSQQLQEYRKRLLQKE